MEQKALSLPVVSVWGALGSNLEVFCCIRLSVVVSVDLQIHLPQFCLAALRGASSSDDKKTHNFFNFLGISELRAQPFSGLSVVCECKAILTWI